MDTLPGFITVVPFRRAGRGIIFHIFLWVFLFGSTFACQKQPSSASVGGANNYLPLLSGPDIKRELNTVQIKQGADTFARHCSRCHGTQGEGAADWRKPGSDGKYPPPPLNGSGHEWHHPSIVLRDVILNGRNNMPAWKNTLNSGEVDAVIAYFQSLWPDGVYSAWYEIEHRDTGGS